MTRERLEQTGGTTSQELGIKKENNGNNFHSMTTFKEEKVHHTPQTPSPIEEVTAEPEVRVMPKGRRWRSRTESFYELSGSLFQVHRESSKEPVDLIEFVAKL